MKIREQSTNIFFNFCTCEIENFQKQPFWHQKFVLRACVHGESSTVSKTKFVQLVMFHSSAATEGITTELAFSKV